MAYLLNLSEIFDKVVALIVRKRESKRRKMYCLEFMNTIHSSFFVCLDISRQLLFMKIRGINWVNSVLFQILLPRILQAVVSAYADYSFYQWTGGRKWALFLVLTSWFWFYTASRTLLQTVETALVAIALSKFPFKDGKTSYYEKGLL